MKRYILLLTLAVAAMICMAQQLTVSTSNVAYTFTANSDDMTFTDNGQTLTIQGKAFSVSDIQSITSTSSTTDVIGNTVSVAYNGSTASVEVVGSIAQYLTIAVSGADVTITQSDDLAEEITYTLSGSSTNGSFTMDGQYKATVQFDGLTLTSTTGAPVTIKNGKRIDIELVDGTTSTLTDCANGSQKACLYVKGHPEFTGGGTLNIIGHTAHAFKSGEYTKLKKKLGTINITSSASDGMHIGQYLEMNGGTINISGVAGDGIQIEQTTDDSGNVETDEENTGTITINGGTLTVSTTGEDIKAMKADGAITITDGTLTLTCTGAGSKGITTDGTIDITGGTVYVTTTGGIYNEGSDDDSKPHGVKADGNITISGSAKVYVASNRKAFDTDATFAINGGTVMGIGTKASATCSGTQGATVFTKVSVTGGQTLTYGDVSYTVPASYSNSSANVLVSPYSESSSSESGTNTDSSLADNNVSIVWNGTSATVSAASNVASLVTATVKNGHVTIAQSSSVSDEITYTLSGSSTNGSLYMTGSYKATFAMSSLTLTNPDSAAVNIQDGKRINIKLSGTNTLTDGTGGSQKACLVVKGHAEFKGDGTLNIYGYTNHGIKTGEYMSVKKCTINVLKSAGDGINANEYFLMESGTITMSGIGDDGIQADIDGSTSTGETTDHEDEDSGNIYIQGGTITISVTAQAAKGIKAEGDMKISDGELNITTSGSGYYDSSERDAKGCAGLKTDGNMTISGGTLTLKSTGTGGKCIKCDGALAITGGTITANSTGSNYSYGSYSASAKAIKCDGALTVSGGTTTATASAHEAIESKSTITITAGIVSATSSKDDAINSASDFNIKGGYVMGYAPNNDGLDANGNFNISGGVVYAIGSKSPEVAIDANTEQQKKLTISGGTIITIGPLEGGSTLSQSCYQASSYSANTWYALYNSSGECVLAVKTPSSTSGLGSGMVVTTAGGTPSLKSGVSVSGGTSYFGGMGNIGGTVSGGSSVSLSSYTASSGFGGGGGQPGGGPGGRW